MRLDRKVIPVLAAIVMAAMMSLVNVIPASAQPPEEAVVEAWVARYDGPASGDDGAEAMAVDGLGNVYVTGYSEDDYATIKYDTDGNELWVARYNVLPGSWDWAKAIAVDNLGNVYVTGYSEGDYATIKYDSDGNELWVARYDGPSSGNDCAWAIIVAICLSIVAISVVLLLQGYRNKFAAARLDDMTIPIYIQARSLAQGQASLDEVWTNLSEQAEETGIYIFLVDDEGNVIRQVSRGDSLVGCA